MVRRSFLILLGVCLIFGRAQASSVTQLQFQQQEQTQTWTLDQLKKALKLATLTVNDPQHKTKKTYEGFWLKDVLALKGISEDSSDELGLRCADGYTAVLKINRMKGHKALLAIREVGAKGPGGWTPLMHGKSKITPAPFYLVWDSADKDLPWPYQVVKLEIIDFQAKYGKIFPTAVGPESSEFRGFNLFKSQCYKCHSLNLQGGELGPELNVPKNITEYREESYIRAFMKDASAYRLKSKMPKFPDISDAEFADLISYFHWMKEHKIDTETKP